MTEQEKLRAWVSAWAVAGPELEQIRAAEGATTSLAIVIEQLEDAFQAAMRHAGPNLSSGLVEQQAWFMKVRQS